MTTKKKMGRPPAPWMFDLVELKLNGQWTDPYEIAAHFQINAKTVKSFIEKLGIKPKHEIENGVARAYYKVSELKRATELYVKPWL